MTAASSPENQPEAVIGKYRPILELGRGGMANVYLCVMQGLAGFSKLQVVKRLRPEFAEEPEFRTMFLEEARLAARINHPNVVQTNEVGMDGTNLFIAMEFLEGQSLEELIRRAAKNGKPLAMSFYLPILVEALRGLHFAHELKDFQGHPLKVIHRDVSPHNIFVTYDGQVKVVDFGIAKAADSSQETRTGVLKGKVAYMAPEQIAAKERVDRRADLFAVGAILWRALVGKRLWRGMNDMEILVKITHGDIPSPTTEKEGLDPKLVAICMKALAPNPDQRYATALEMIDAIEGYIATQTQRATTREVGTLVSELFADRRKQITVAIEKRMGELDTNAISWSSFDSPLSMNSRGAFTPSHISGSMSAVSPVSDSSMPAPASSGAALPSEIIASRRRPSRMPLALGLLAVAAVAAFVAFRMRVVNAAKAAAATTQKVEAPAPTASAQSDVQLQIKLVPADAVITIDDKPLGPGTHFTQDGVVHRVRVSANHYEPEVRVVTFDSPTVSLDFNLRKEAQASARITAPVAINKTHPAATTAEPPPPPATTTAAAPPPPATTTAAAPSATATSKKLGIDSSNPWK